MSNTREVTPAQRAAVISKLRTKGDTYGHAGIAGLAHELARQLDGDKLARGAATIIGEATGYDKGNVSRIAKIVRTDHKARAAALALDVMHIDDNATTLAHAVEVGLMFKRTSSSSSSRTRVADEPDYIADLATWLTESTPEQYAARISQVHVALANVEAERATIAASEAVAA